MKQTSIDKLNAVYEYLREPGESALNDGKAAELIKDIIRAEALVKAKSGKFDIYNYVGNNEFRPAMQGVFHDGGYRVASDAIILVAVKEDYSSEIEGQVIFKDGKPYEIDEHRKTFTDEEGKEHRIYPKWKEIIPDGLGYESYKVDAQKFYDWVDERRVEDKAVLGKKARRWNDFWMVAMGPAHLKAEYFAKFLDAMRYIGADEVLVKDERRAVLARSEKGCVLLMPRINTENYKTLKLA